MYLQTNIDEMVQHETYNNQNIFTEFVLWPLKSSNRQKKVETIKLFIHTSHFFHKVLYYLQTLIFLLCMEHFY